MKSGRSLRVHCATLVSALLGFCLMGCASRNIHGKTLLPAERPLERGLTLMTRDYIFDAGQEPFDAAGTVADEDSVFVTSERVGVEAFHRNGFQRKWVLKLKNGVSSEPLLDGSNLFFGANDGNFYALDAEFGKPLWKYPTKVPVYAQPVLYSQRVYLVASDDVIYCLDQATGKWIWHYKRGGSYITTVRGNAAPVIDSGLVFVGFSDGYEVALGANDGNLRWEAKVHSGSKFTDVDAPALIDRETLYVPSYDGGLYALAKKTGKVLWHVDFGSSRGLVLDGKQIYLASSDGFIYALNKDSGKMLWRFELDRGAPTAITLWQNYLFFGSSQQYFYALHKGDGSLAYRFDAGQYGGFVANPFYSGGELFAFSALGNLYVFRTVNMAQRGR
jgi:outer membrane protein assembly factor BamB